MEGEILSPEAPLKEEKKSKTWLIILIVVLVLGLCCCVVPAILYFTGDSLLQMLGIDPTTIYQGF